MHPQAIDADTDGKVGLSDYINFAARLKGIHTLQQQMVMDMTLSEPLDEGAPAAVVSEPTEPSEPSEPADPRGYGE